MFMREAGYRSKIITPKETSSLTRVTFRLKMDVLEADREEGVAFIWKIQNYNFCFRENKDIYYESPAFVLNDKSSEKWCLQLYPERYFSHDSIGIVLKKCTETKATTFNNGLGRNVLGAYGYAAGHRPGEEFCQVFGEQSHQNQPTNQPTHDILLEVSICDVSGSFEKKFRNKLMFRLNPDKSDNLKLKINKEELETYLKNDSITILCKLSDMKNPILTMRHCYARTIIGVERITYPCTVEGFTDLENGGNIAKNFHIFSEVTSFTMNFFSTRETYSESKLHITIQLTEPKVQCYSICEISLVDADGGIAHSVREEHDFDHNNLAQSWIFPFIEVRKILNNKELVLSNGVLRLRCEFGFSSGVTYNKVERTEFGTENSHQLKCSGQITDSDFPESLKKNLQRFYEEGKFSDVTIRTPSKQFRVHKSILCARSEVFSAMFERDMKENQTGVVEIEDIDDDTISKMLLFMYTDTVEEDLEFKTASSLYFAADKYRIVALKRKCADFLKSTFTVSNVCDLLVLADMHQDEELKSASQKFIFEHSGEVMKSEEWKTLMQNQTQMASETMHLFIQNLKI